jgi:tetratricopeptide (TPR) repeat protein
VETLAPQQLPPAVDALVRQAERQRQSSDYAGAAATLERALRLQSREAYLWNRLAHVRLEQGLATQAANLAARANDLSGDNASLRGDNWRVIANAKRRTGDLQGAQEAERRAASGG